MNRSFAMCARAHCVSALLWLALPVSGQVTYTDNFNSNLNYLTNGVTGTIWDGVYFGAGDFNNSGLGGGGPGATLQCDANITAPGELTLQTTGTAWENADDDGFFLFKVVKGDFSMSVHVVSPYNNAAYNTAGLQARAFAAGGDPSTGTENYVSWTRFDEYGFANYLRNEVNGGAAQLNPGNSPNNNYWLRMDRVRGTNFMFYERATLAGQWLLLTNFPAPLVSGRTLQRPDLAGQPLQVGIIHATFSGQLGVQFTTFSLTESNAPFATVPSPATGLALSTNGGNLNVSWTPGAGSSGSLVAVWTGTNSAVKEIPANGFSYTANPGYGLGATLPGKSYFVVYNGAGNSVTVTNLALNTAYNVAVFSYAGSGTTLAYSHSPATSSVLIPPNQISAQVDIQSADVLVSFVANPGKWYWLQYSDSLSPAHWQNVVPGPVIATNTLMSILHAGGATAPYRYYRIQQQDPLFTVDINNGNITSLTFTDGASPEFIGGGGRLGNALLEYRAAAATTWNAVQTANLSGVASASYSTSPDGTQVTSHYVITNNLPGSLVFESVFTFEQDTLLWTLHATNLSSQPLVIGNLALPLPMNTSFSGATSSTMKHSFISGYDSFIFWMRPDSVAPYLLLTPDAGTKLEYWDVLNGYEAYIHSYVAATNAAAQNPSVTTQGQRWRQPTTSLTLGAGASQSYSFKFQWVTNYEAIRQALVDNGKIDVHVVPGMTVPTNLFAQFALNTTQPINSVTAEFPGQTQIQALGNNGTYQLYQVQFARLGENELTINYGSGQTMVLEFFVTEPIESLIKKRAAWLVSHQIITNTWYTGLFCDFNMNDEVLITPDNHDTLDSSFQVYEIASDDAGESRPAYLAAKESVFPVQSEVSALDYYIQNFVWGGLQRTTNESSSYAIYGVPDWHTLRTGNNLSIGRGYDYPHIIVMYYGMYQVAKHHPEITTTLSAAEYLQRAWGTAMALWSYGGSQATQVGLMNEVVIPDLLRDLVAEGMTNQATSLRANWEAKVNYYVTGNADLFASEYAFDSTGFESQEAYAKYAMDNLGSDVLMGSTNPAAFLQQAQNYLVKQITANVFDRGWLEAAYYDYGSDYRGDMGDDYIVTYMSQMGGWGLLDYALNFAANPADYLRLGYASYLNGWCTMNSGPESDNYGFWYPGAVNDGGCGGGYEPSPYNVTWLGGQPMHRGPWYYSAEENLGFCGAIRSAASILADDPIFGRFCFGGTWQQTTNLQIVPLDGVRRRFHALLTGGSLHAVIDTDRFADGQPILLQPDLSQFGFTLETGNSAAHTARLHFSASTPGTYVFGGAGGTIATVTLAAGQEVDVDLPMPAATTTTSFTVSR